MKASELKDWLEEEFKKIHARLDTLEDRMLENRENVEQYQAEISQELEEFNMQARASELQSMRNGLRMHRAAKELLQH